MHCPLDFTLIFPDAGSTAFIESSIITIHDLVNLRVNTNDYSLADQQIRVTVIGALRTNANIKKESNLTVVFSACPSSGLIITPTFIVDKIYATGDSHIFTFDAWTTSVTGCSNIAYTSFLAGVALPSWITFDSTLRLFTVV